MRKLGLVVLVAFAAVARADWPADSGLDVPVASVDTSTFPTLVNDGQSGVFVIFSHSDGGALTVRGEHFSAQADRLWAPTPLDDGGHYAGKDLLGLSLGAAYSGKALAVSDDNGGFIAAYSAGQYPSSTLNIQRFDGGGNPQWTPTALLGGVQLLANPIGYDTFWLVPDQHSGALITLETSQGIVGQRLDSTGAPQYGMGFPFANGQYPGPFYASQFLSPDGLGGMYYIWPTSGSATNLPALDHVGPDGGLVFSVPSVAPLQALFEQWSIAGLPAGGGSWATWYQSGTPGHLYLQLFLADGSRAFPDAGPLFLSDGGLALPDAGVAGGLIVTGTNAYPDPTLVGDGQGGTIVAWFDTTTTSLNVIYAQRYSADGSTPWGNQPVLVSSAATPPTNTGGYLRPFRIVPTSDGNVGVVWSAMPNGIYAEKIDVATGTKLWGPLSGGIAVSTATYPSWTDVIFVEDDSAYVAYEDQQSRVFVKHVRADGTLGPTVADAGVDAGMDAGIDAGMDAGVDAGLDAGADAGPDGGIVVGFPDGGGDAGIDGGMDAGGTDAGENGDAGTTKSGGGCSTSGGGPIGAVMLVFVGFAALRRRWLRGPAR
jgi:uncharacterized protein (TIGR03382 family)